MKTFAVAAVFAAIASADGCTTWKEGLGKAYTCDKTGCKTKDANADQATKDNASVAFEAYKLACPKWNESTDGATATFATVGAFAAAAAALAF